MEAAVTALARAVLATAERRRSVPPAAALPPAAAPEHAGSLVLRPTAGMDGRLVDMTIKVCAWMGLARIVVLAW